MRFGIIAAISLLAVAAADAGISKMAGWNPHLPALLVAGVTCIAASRLALLPLWLSRGADQVVMTQAALVGTMVHLFFAAAVAAVVLLGHIRLGSAFVLWLLAFYWVTLGVLALGFIKAVKGAPVAGRNR